MGISDWLRDPALARNLSRRRFLIASGQVAALGAAATLLAACGGDDDDDDEEPTATTAAADATPTTAAEATATTAAPSGPTATTGSGTGDATPTVPRGPHSVASSSSVSGVETSAGIWLVRRVVAHIAGLERILILGQSRIAGGWHFKSARQIALQQARGLQVFETG